MARRVLAALLTAAAAWTAATAAAPPAAAESTEERLGSECPSESLCVYSLPDYRGMRWVIPAHTTPGRVALKAPFGASAVNNSGGTVTLAVDGVRWNDPMCLHSHAPTVLYPRDRLSAAGSPCGWIDAYDIAFK